MTALTNLKYFFALCELVALLACVYFGVQWIIDPAGDYEPSFAISTLVLIAIDIVRRYVPSKGIDPEKIADFIQEGQALRARLNETPLPIQEHNEWIDRMAKYFRRHKGAPYETRISDFSGMTFYGDGSERSKLSNSIEGRVRRLHEFISEISSK